MCVKPCRSVVCSLKEVALYMYMFGCLPPHGELELLGEEGHPIPAGPKAVEWAAWHKRRHSHMLPHGVCTAKALLQSA